MKEISLEEIARATGGRIMSPTPVGTDSNKNIKINNVQIDSRNSRDKSLFFALKGENRDGHVYIQAAVENGARICVIERDDAPFLKDVFYVLVDDTKKALQDLAGYYLKREGIKVIGVTGSVGKTTTKDIAKSVFSKRCRTGASIKNYNGDVGVPLSVFALEEDVDIAILEMAMDHKGEIKSIVDFANPIGGIITNVGFAHMETVGTRQDILEAKMEIASNFNQNSFLVINEDNEMLAAMDQNKAYKIIHCGLSKERPYRAENIENLGIAGTAFDLVTPHWMEHVKLDIPGEHNALNTCLVVAAADEMGLSKDEILAGLRDVKTTDKRQTIRHSNSLTIIDDSYNAAPESTKSGLLTLLATPTNGKRAALLSDMYGQGSTWPEMHQDVGRFAMAEGLDLLIAVGERGRFIYQGAVENLKKGQKAYFFKTKDELMDRLEDILGGITVCLVKGSRATEMDKVVDKILELDI